MSETAIHVENISKRYVIGHQRNGKDGLRHAIEHAFRNPFRWFQNRRKSRQDICEEFWALKDVSFEVKAGEVIGFIGRNGAGKSTLLKTLSRITEPTRGRIRMRGRVSSLLEVGTGFHPELTGRENIFLNGAILGMGRVEIRRKFDEIVSFAGLEKFLDTPVKRYSSGMYVRLAFAVAAHLEPEILIVDEVLAVGDAEFQKKCLSKMDDVGQTGRTVLFVSHNMQAVARLCQRCILLERGQLKLDGPARQVANAYLHTGAGTSAIREWAERKDAPGNELVRMRAIRVITATGEVSDNFDIRHPIGIEMEYNILKSGFIFHPHFGVQNEDGNLLFVAQDIDAQWRGRNRPIGRYITTGWIPGNLLAEGVASIHFNMITLEPETRHIEILDAVQFRVVDCLEARDTSRGDYLRPIPGLMRPMLEWKTQYFPAAELAEVGTL